MFDVRFAPFYQYKILVEEEKVQIDLLWISTLHRAILKVCIKKRQLITAEERFEKNFKGYAKNKTKAS